MKLVMWKSFDLRKKYAHILMKGMDWYSLKGVVDAVTDRRLDHLRGCTFDEVLWVGYENGQEVDLTAPEEILNTCYGSRFHYCKPAEPQNDPSKPSYTLNLPNGSSVDFKVLQPSLETDELVEEYRSLPESLRLSMALGEPVWKIKVKDDSTELHEYYYQAKWCNH